MKTLKEIAAYVLNYLYVKAPSLLLATIVLFAGLFVIRRLTVFLEKTVLSRNIEASLVSFLSSTLRFILVIILLITVASMLGISIATFVAVIGAAGLTVGLALQKSLANFAGGMVILFYKPFIVGEYIAADGMEGAVERIDILNTTLCTSANQVLVIPNGLLANARIINYSRKMEKRACVKVGVSYDTDIDYVKKLIMDALKEDPLILDVPVPTVYVESLGNGAINLAIHCWATAMNYMEVNRLLTEKIKKIFDAHQVRIS